MHIFRNRQKMTENNLNSLKNSLSVTTGVTKLLTNIIKTICLI